MPHRNADLQLLRIDPTLCAGVGMCAHVAFSIVRLDPWGYPVLPGDALGERQVAEANRAIRACPRHALFMETREFAG